MPTSYEDIGLPVVPNGAARFAGVQYSRAGRILIATVREGERASTARIFLRSIDDSVYAELAPLDASYPFWNAVVLPDVSSVFLSAQEYADRGLHVLRMNPPYTHLERLPPPSLHEPHARFWISSLVGASSDASCVFVKVGIQPQPAPDGGYHVRYVLAEMDVQTGRVTVAGELPAGGA